MSKSILFAGRCEKCCNHGKHRFYLTSRGIKYIRGRSDPLDHPVLFMQMQNCSHSRCFIALFKLTLNVLIDEISTASLGSLLHHPIVLSVRQHSLWSHVFLLYLFLLVFWQNDSLLLWSFYIQALVTFSQSPFILLFVFQFSFFFHPLILPHPVISASFPHTCEFLELLKYDVSYINYSIIGGLYT